MVCGDPPGDISVVAVIAGQGALAEMRGNIRHETMRCTIGQPRMEEINLTSKIDIDVWVPDLGLPGWMDRWHQQAEEFNTLHPDYQVTVTGLDFFTFPQGPGEEAAAGRTPAPAEYSPAGAGPAHR
jgi:hypothetical protein